MSPEEAFIRAVEANPSADMPRLVYADWLDENGREPFADFLRTELELAKLPLDSPAAPPLRERLWQAWAAVDAVWLHRFTQPKMLRANPTPFPAVWMGTDLDDIREGDGTYDGWEYHTLPPLPTGEFLGTFEYLGPPALTEQLAQYAPQRQQQWDTFRQQALETGLHLPPGFVEFMSHPSRQFSIRSCTDNYFTLPTKYDPVRSAVSGRGVHVLFYADSQYCLLWDLFLHPSGAHCVIARDPDSFAPEPADPDEDEPVGTGPRVWFVAPSFEAFVYREWIENRIWFSLYPNFYTERGEAVPPVTPAIQAYIDHYRNGEGR